MKNGDKIFKIVIIFATIIFVFVPCFYVFQFAKMPLSVDNGVWGQFGDYVGGTLNPVFGFLSLVILLSVLRQNERALQMSKEELELTRQELKNSATALAEQSETLKIQRFEQTFFSLLSLYREITVGLITQYLNNRNPLKPIIEEKHGKDAIEHLLHQLRTKVTEGSQHGSRTPKYDLLETFRELYKKFLRGEEQHFTRYIKTLYRILEFIDSADIDDKQIYANLLKDQLSQSELCFLLYYAIGISDDNMAMYVLINNYDILEDLNHNYLINKDVDLKIFEELKRDIESANVAKKTSWK